MKVALITIANTHAAIYVNDSYVMDVMNEPFDSEIYQQVLLAASNLAIALGVKLESHKLTEEPSGSDWGWNDVLKLLPASAGSHEVSSEQVAHWDAYAEDSIVMTHQIDVDDQRKQTGQLFIDVGSKEEMVDDMMCVTVEVHTNPLNGADHVPCAHIHFDGDNLAVSLFKIGDRILARPETYVSIEPFRQKVNGVEETFFWIDGK